MSTPPVGKPSLTVSGFRQTAGEIKAKQGMDRPKLLIVEDHPLDQQLMLGLLEHALPDYETTVVETAELAQAMIATGQYAAVLVDHHLPGMTGVDLARSFGSLDAHPSAFVLISGGADLGIVANAFRAGIHDFIPKEQLSSTAVRRIIQSAIDARAQRLDELKQLRELTHRASLDALTGVGNRHAFNERVKIMLTKSQHYTRPFGLLAIDLDRFKHINDTHGHDTGDQVLVSVASRLCHRVRTSDAVFRFGGDEFVVLLDGWLPGAPTQRLLDQLREDISQPHELSDGGEILCSASLGLSACPQDGHTLEALFKAADSRMYGDKRLRRESA